MKDISELSWVGNLIGFEAGTLAAGIYLSHRQATNLHMASYIRNCRSSRAPYQNLKLYTTLVLRDQPTADRAESFTFLAKFDDFFFFF